jgi:hypothetical protein
LSEYPVFTGYDIVDQHTDGTVYTIKCCYTLPTGLPPDLLSKQKIDGLNAYVRRPVYEHTIKPHEESVELYIQLTSRDLSLMKYRDFVTEQTLRVPIGFDLKYRTPVYCNFDETTVKE